MASLTKGHARVLALPLAISIAMLAGCNHDTTSQDNNQQDDALRTSYIETYSYAGSPAPESDQAQMTTVANAQMDRTLEGISSHQGNYVFSPYEEANTLGMLALGVVTDPAAQGAIASREQQLHALISPALWQRSTGLWGHENYLFLDSYLDAISRYYNPQIAALSFKTDVMGSTQAISDWLAAASDGKLLPLTAFASTQIGERTRLVTLNMEKLNGEWPAPFDATQTSDERFKMLDGTMKLIPTMHTSGTFNVLATDQYRAFQLLLKNSTLALMIIMPKEGEFENVQKQLASEPLLEKITASLHPVETTLHLPRFSIETVEELATPADGSIDYGSFANVNGQGYLLLKQKARMATIDVAEIGVTGKAGGLTVLDATEDEPGSVWGSSGFTMANNPFSGQVIGSTPCYYPPLIHPFIFVLRETTTATTLYAGVWTTPAGYAMAPDWSTDASGPDACATPPADMAADYPVWLDTKWGTSTLVTDPTTIF